MTARPEDWLIRSLLFVPAHSPSKLAHALESEADALILDLEDSVEPAAKEEARRLAALFLKTNGARPNRPRLYVRVNGLDSGLINEDLAAIAPCAPDGLVFPKPRSGSCVTAFAQAIEAEERRASTPLGSTRIIAISTETPQALLTMGSFVDCSPRLTGLAWGAEDLSLALNAAVCRDDAGALTAPYFLARCLCLITAHAAHTLAIDGVYVNFRDLEGLDREAREAARDGFSAKLAIHPAQAPVINRAFTPTAENVAEAEAIISAFAAQGNPGVISWRGRMLDRPHLEKARRSFAQAKLLSAKARAP
jgi:citrate lyase subunit beta / citryl-CoA lyase